MSEIQSLTDRAVTLTQSVDWWNTAMIWALIAAALAAAAVVVTTRMSVKRTGELAGIQAQLIRAKDAELLRELKEKDEQIANARRDAAHANERAEAAKAEAAKANERILKMQRMRRLDKEKAAALVPLLKSDLFQSEPKPCLRIGSVKDVEAQMYAMDFQRLLESCSVNIYPTQGGLANELVQLDTSADGLQLKVKSLSNPMPAFVQFQHQVHALGINIPVGEDPSLRDNEAMLEILKKPD